MKVLWLNDSLVLRAESPQEKEALSIVGKGLKPLVEEDADQNTEECLPRD
jgi:hypothetical protein